jgi:site-specific recombinase XerD
MITVKKFFRKIPLGDYTGTFLSSPDAESRRRTFRAYQTAARSFTGFLASGKVYIDDINASNIESYQRHLKSRNLKHNTISCLMRNLKVIYRRATAENLTPCRQENPFKNIFTGAVPTEKRALPQNKLQKLWQASENIDEKRKKALLLFFFSFFAQGITFVDMAFLKKISQNGNTITFYRRKTKTQMRIVLSPQALKIIKRFAPSVSGSPYLFPIIDPEKGDEERQYESALRQQNRLLNSIGQRLGLDRPLTTYVARHSWATIARSLQTPLSVISEGLGHRNEKTTEIYLNLLENNVLEKANSKIAACICGKNKTVRHVSDAGQCTNK